MSDNKNDQAQTWTETVTNTANYIASGAANAMHTVAGVLDPTTRDEKVEEVKTDAADTLQSAAEQLKPDERTEGEKAKDSLNEATEHAKSAVADKLRSGADRVEGSTA